MEDTYSSKENIVVDIKTGGSVCLCNPTGEDKGIKMAEYIAKLMNQEIAREYIRSIP